MAEHSSVHLEEQIDKIYDHLYANASVKTPKAIAFEVMKVLRTALFLEPAADEGVPAFGFLRAETRILSEGNRAKISYFADWVRKNFMEMNNEFQFYPHTEMINLSDFDLVYVCRMLAEIHLSGLKRDVLGDALEIFRSHWVKTHGGQFFTDQNVTHLAMTLLQFDPRKGDDLVDICAGTGGFLLAGLDRIRSLVNFEKVESPEKAVATLACSSLFGQEIDSEICSVANDTLALRLGNGFPPIVVEGNSLLPASFVDDVGGKIKYNSHSCAATNPPFGTKITVKDPDILKNYELSTANNGKISPRAPDILFIEQNIKLLKPGSGMLAIVIPYQIASGPQAMFVREWLFKHASLIAVVDLPKETFQPHTGTKASLIVVRRRQEPLESIDLSKDPPVFMAIPQWIGHDRRGNPVYRRAGDGKYTAELLTDFDEVVEAFDVFVKDGNPSKIYEQCFVVKASYFSADSGFRFDANFCRSSKCRLKFSDNDERHSQWSSVKLKEVAKEIYYPTRFKRNYVERSDRAVPFLGGKNISQMIVDTDKWISVDDPKLADLKVESGWILVTRSGTTGIVSIVPDAWDGYAVSEHVIRIIPDEEKISPEYLYAFLRTRYAQKEISRWVYGSVVDEINPKILGNLDIPIPKDIGKADEISKIICRGEKARQRAMELLVTGANMLEELLSE